MQFQLVNHSRRGQGEKELLKPKNLELVYLQQSPNYCEKSILLGSSGKEINSNLYLSLINNIVNRNPKSKMQSNVYRS